MKRFATVCAILTFGLSMTAPLEAGPAGEPPAGEPAAGEPAAGGPPTSVEGSPSAPTAQDPQQLLWVTMGEDLFDGLQRQHSLLSSLTPPEAVASDAGVVITRLAVADLEAVSHFAHQAHNRCGGFIVHGSLAEARGALQSVRDFRNLPAPASFSVNQQALVQSLLPNITESNVLSTFTHLSTAYNNRYYQNNSGQVSAEWIRDLWLGYATGRSDVSVQTVSHSGYVQPSVVLTIQGNSLASEVVVFGAHLDSIRSGSTNSESTLAPGADDDASGIASLSEVIRVLLSNGFTPDRTVKFMGYAAEEVGLRGSGDIAQQHLDDGINVVGMMQLDMTAFNGSVEDIVFMSDFTNAELTAFSGQLIDTYLPGVQHTTDLCGYGCSDHASWHNRGFPAVMPFEARFGQHNQTIHSGNDTVATLSNSAAHAVKFSRLALAFAVEAGMADCTPSPLADAGPDQNINEGGSIQIGTAAQSGHTYSWSPGGATTAQITVSPASTTVYTVTATTSCGSTQDAVTVNVTPAGSNGPQNAVFNGGLGVPACAVAGSSCDSQGLLDGRAGLGPESNQPNTLDGCADGTSGTYHSDESNDRIVVSTLDGANFSAGATVQVEATVYAYSTGSSDTLDLYYAADAGAPSWTLITSMVPSAGGVQTLSANYTLPSGTQQAVRARFRYQGSANACNNGSYDDADDLVFAVESAGGNTAPTVAIGSPSNGASFVLGANVSFSGSANDSQDGNIGNDLSWTSSIDGSIGTGTSFSTSSLSAGSHTITASVTDSGGLSDSAQVGITVSTPSNAPPSVALSAPSNGASFDQGTSVSFAATANDAEDGTLTGSLSWTSSIDGNIGSGGSFSSSSLSLGSHTITASVTDSGGLTGNAQVSISIDAVGGGCGDCINWNSTATVSYSNQDTSPNATVVDGGDGLLLQGNTWRRTTQTFNVTANTVIEVDFESTVQGEIHGIGFDEDDTLSNNNRLFQLHGTQTWTTAFQDFNNYSSGVTTYTIPVGQFYTGSSMYLVLSNDNDAGSGNNSWFRNVRVYEDTPPPGSCAAQVSFDGGAAGWVHSGSSTCTTGSFVAATPTAQSNGGVTTQVGGDHTSGSGNAFFTGTNSSAGNADVDGGNCIAESPVYAVSEASDLAIWYFHGQRDAGDDSGDFFRLEISTDGGTSYSPLVDQGDITSNAVWTQATATVAAGSNVKLRLQVSDGTGGGDLVEGGVDDLSICPQ